MANALEQGIFADYPIAAWQVGTLARIAFAIDDLEESGGNRIAPKERPYRDGAKLDDTGAKPRQWSFRAVFNNSLDEPGLEDNPQAPYPNTLNALLASFELHETGTLTLPTVGDVRARLDSYTRRELSTAREEGSVQCTFLEDNEDALDRAQLTPPQVVSSIVRLAEQTTFSAQSNGSWDDRLAELTDTVEDLQGAMLAPGRAANDIGARVNANRRNLNRIITTQRKIAAQTGGLGNQPRGSGAERQARTMSDRQARAVDERNTARQSRPFVVDVPVTSLAEIAARFNQDAGELFDLNDSTIADPMTIFRGETVRVFVTVPR